MLDDALTVVVCGASASMTLTGYLARLHPVIDRPLRLVLTHTAGGFLRAEALANYADEVSTADQFVNPTEIARRSRAIVVLPATAHMLAAAALGLAATPAQTLLLAAEQPVLFFPSMNGVLWNRPTTKRHVAALRGDGHCVVDPVEREVYEVWSRQVIMGPSLPPQETVAAVVREWLAHG